jgi:hypothetical protein
LLVLCCLALASCSNLPSEPTESVTAVVEPPRDAEPAVVVTSPAPDSESAAAEAAAPEPLVASAGGGPEPSVAASAAPEPNDAASAASEPPTSMAAVDSSAAAAAASIPEDSGASPRPGATASLPAETLDFESLVTRLRRTKAISLLTKVSVKNQSDDLLQEFRAYHTRHGTATLAELRRSYDSLFGTLCSLLEEGDPPLARDINRSRAAIWEVLADPRKFSASELLAGG